MLQHAPSSKQANTPSLLQQTSYLAYASFLCLPGFFVVVLTALLPFNTFIRSDKTTTEGIITYIPLILGGTFLLAIFMSLLALLLLLGSSELKKQIALAKNAMLNAAHIQRQMKRLRCLRTLIVCFFILAAGINIALNIAIYMQTASL